MTAQIALIKVDGIGGDMGTKSLKNTIAQACQTISPEL